MKKNFNLQRFTDGGSAGESGNGGQGGNAGYTYEQLEEIAGARVERAEKAAIAGYLRNKGMSEEDITTAIEDFKQKKKASIPDVSAVTKERDDALAKVAQYEHEKILSGKGVASEDLDYVAFKVNAMVTDKKDFKTCAEEFLKDNPRFAGGSTGYKVSTGSSSGNSNEGKNSGHDEINNMIRSAFRR